MNKRIPRRDDADYADTEARMDKAQEEAQKRQEKAQEQVNRQKEVAASWSRIKKEPAVVDLIAFLSSQRSALIEVAIAGGGISGGNEVVVITSEDRIANLNKISGLDIALGYVERKLP